MTDVLEILVAWDAGEGQSGIARRLGYSRVTVQKYVAAATAGGLRRGAGRRDEAEWVGLAQAAGAGVRWRSSAPPGAVAAQVAAHHAYLEERIGRVPIPQCGAAPAPAAGAGADGELGRAPSTAATSPRTGPTVCSARRR